jgi:hypothetical protein
MVSHGQSNFRLGLYSRRGKESGAISELQKGLALQGADDLAAAVPA